MSGNAASAPDDKSRIIQEFDAKAETYDSGTHANMYHAHNDFIIDLMSVAKGDTVLDIGCAGGYLLRTLGRHTPGLKGIGNDISPRMTERAQAQAKQDGLPDLSFFCCDWERPAPDLLDAIHNSRITHAVCASAMHYFSDPQGSIGRIHDALVPGGVLYILERRLTGSPVNHLWNFLHAHVVKDHVVYYHDREVTGFCKQAGFAEARRVRTIRKFFWNNKIYTDLCIFEALKA